MSLVRLHRRQDSASGAVLAARLDRMTLAAPVVLPTGGKRVEGVLAHVGVLTYTSADDPAIPAGHQRRELVRADTLSDPALLDALQGLPVTVEHVPGAKPGNMARVRVGTVLSAHFDAASGELRGTLVVDDARGLDALARGLTDVSLGYDVEIAETPGDWTAPDGATHRYDAVQVRRVPNHLALTRKGRAGKARVRADGAPMPLLLALLAPHGITFAEDADEATIAAAVKARLDAIQGEADAAKGRADAATPAIAERDTARADLAKMQAGDGDAFRAAFKGRADALALATKHGVKDAEKLDTSALRKEVVKAALGARADAAKLDQPAYVDAILDTLDAGLVDRKDARFDAVRDAHRSARADAADQHVGETATQRQRRLFDEAARNRSTST